MDSKNIRDLWNKIKDESDEDKIKTMIDGLNEDELEDLANQSELISPYSFHNIVDGDLVLFSALNLKEQYMMKETAVSFSSFMYRMLDEEEIPENEKQIINKFMGKYLEFNPDIHVKSSYNKKNAKDTERPDMATLDRELVKHIAPEDTFRRWKLYHEANYDALRVATQTLYAEKPDIEHAIIVYEKFSGKTAQQDADEFIKKYKDDFKTDVFTIRKGKWAFIGPFAANREKVNIYSKDSEILEELLKKREEEMKLGQDMLKNRVKKAKKEHNQTDEQIPELNEFKEIVASLNRKGIKNLNKDEMRKFNYAKDHIHKAQLEEDLALLTSKGIDNFTPDETFKYRELKEQIKSIEESMEIPEGAVQVNVYETAPDGTFEVNKLYTKAETQEETAERLRKQEYLERKNNE